MTKEEIQKLKTLLTVTATYYGKELIDPVLLMMVEDLSGFDFEELSQAFKNYRLNPANRFFPLPAQIIATMNPAADPRHMASDLSKKLIAVINKRGWTWIQIYRYDGHATLEEAITAELGTVALEVIRRRGGWQMVHDDYYASEPATFFAQLRDHIESVYTMAKNNTLYSNPELPNPQKTIVHVPSKGLPWNH